MDRRTRHARDRGSALLLAIFIMAISAPLVCLMLECHTVDIRCVHNHIENMRALYLAQAGIEHAFSELMADPNWSAGFDQVACPPDTQHTYSVTLVDDGSGKRTLTSVGTTKSGHTKTVVVAILCSVAGT